ncbi:MAG: sulfatase-like hydrolase/transferase [Longimicrobiales bacterium]
MSAQSEESSAANESTGSLAHRSTQSAPSRAARVRAAGEPSAAARVPLLEFCLIAAWFALVTALAELVVVAIRTFVMGRMLEVHPQAVWMIPAGYGFFFAMLAVPLFLANRRWLRLASWRWTTGLFAFISALSFLLLFHPQLHKVAILVLACGIAVQASRVIEAHPTGFRRLIRSTVPAFLTAIAGLSTWVNVTPVLREQRALASLPAAVSGAPNVLLIILDTVRAASLSLYGYERSTTPNLERFAREGVVFERAISTAPWTLPSHASLFTGLFPHESNADWLTPLEAGPSTLAEVFAARGYRTTASVANTIYAGNQTGLDRGFATYADYHVSPSWIIGSTSLGRFLTRSQRVRRVLGQYELLGRKPAPRVSADFLSWLSKTGDRPFFAFLNYFDAHEPFLPPAPFDRQFLTTDRPGFLDRLWNGGDPLTQRIQRRQDPGAHMAMYDGAIRYLDQELNEFLEELRARGVLDNTIVVITADHGEEFLEHAVPEHGNSLYYPSIHVPLVIRFPGAVPSGSVVQDAVSLRDVPATILDLVGETNASLPGTSLVPSWTGGSSDRSLIFSELTTVAGKPASYPVSKGDMVSIVSGNLHLIRNGDGVLELYDLDADPWEKNNLASSPAYAAALARLRDALPLPATR